MMLRFVLVLTFISACGEFQSPSSKGNAISHALWDAELKKFVDDKGWVNYKQWQDQQQSLNNYLDLLSENPPDEQRWTQQEQLAYWINAYNAFTINLILKNYPVESITDLHPTFYVPGINTVWHDKFFKIGDKPTSLDEIEHKILRVKFDEPRIHFAIVCASYSCPKLRNEAFTAEKIEEQLQAQAVDFINDPDKNIIKPSAIELSRIFQWFKGDFTKNGSLVDFLNKYSTVTINSNADIDYLKYNWDLNGK